MTLEVETGGVEVESVDRSDSRIGSTTWVMSMDAGRAGAVPCAFPLPVEGGSGVPVGPALVQRLHGFREPLRELIPEIAALSTADDLVKLQNVVSHADQGPLPSYFLQSA